MGALLLCVGCQKFVSIDLVFSHSLKNNACILPGYLLSPFLAADSTTEECFNEFLIRIDTKRRSKATKSGNDGDLINI